MKSKAFFWLAFVLALPASGFAQSKLSFPKFFSAVELPNSGFAIVNPSGSSATVTFTLYSQSGSVVSTSTQTYGSGTQTALLGNQIFSTLGTGGWVQASSVTGGLQGFWLNYDPTASVYLDGAAAVTNGSGGNEIPAVASTELNVANFGSSAASVTIQLQSTDGSMLATQTETIPPMGVFQSDVFNLFSMTPSTTPLFVRVLGTVNNSPASLGVTAVIRNWLVSKEDGVINGQDEAATATTLYLPHAVSGPLGSSNYTTVLGVTNLTGTAQTVNATFYNCNNPTNGSTIAVPTCTASAPVPITFGGRGTFSDSIQHFFGLAAGTFVDGYVALSGTSPLGGYAAYADTAGGAMTIVPAQSAGSTNVTFAHIANLPPWQTGLALLNPNAVSATVDIYAMTPAGTLIGGESTDPATATLTMAPTSKGAWGLSQLIPETAVQNATHPTDGGFVYIQSTQPINAIELFYDANVSVLSNVAGSALASGITYTPPAAGAIIGLPAQTTFSGTMTISGVCSGSGTTASSGPLTVIVKPSVTALTSTGGSFNSVTWSSSSSGTSCSGNPESHTSAGSGSGSLSAGGSSLSITLNIPTSSGTCAATATGTVSQLSGIIPASCYGAFDGPGSSESGTFTLSFSSSSDIPGGVSFHK